MIKMKNISKPFARWATNFKNKPFLWARLKLTSFYTGGVLIILLVFSIVVFALFVRDISSNLEYEGTGYENEADIESRVIVRAQNRLGTIIVTIDGLTIILIAGLSYYLAGKTLEPIELAYVRQKKFVADAAHELRTPLSVMKTGTEAVLAGNNGKEEYRKVVKDYLEEINHLSVMVDDLLFLARSDNLRKTELYKIDFSKLIARQIELMRPYAEKKQIILKNEVQDGLYIKGNKLYLKRLLYNIIKNAIDYNKPGGEAMVILKKVKSGIELKVSDTGIGISGDDLKHVFDRFYKADQSHTERTDGAGLGLSIVQEIVKLHKATIEIKSKPGSGTAVIIIFPSVS